MNNECEVEYHRNPYGSAAQGRFEVIRCNHLGLRAVIMTQAPHRFGGKDNGYVDYVEWNEKGDVLTIDSEYFSDFNELDRNKMFALHEEKMFNNIAPSEIIVDKE